MEVDTAARSHTSGIETRYDPQTMQEVLERAWRLQTRHGETFSAADVERVGQELGVDPRFVREALAQTGAAPGKRQWTWARGTGSRAGWAAPVVCELLLFL